MAEKIMIVDDEAIIRRTYSQALESDGHTVVAAESAEVALECLEHDQAIQLVFADIQMSGMDGMELLTIARKRFPSADFIIMTAYGSIDSGVEAIKRGALDYLLKPIDFHELKHKAELALNRRRLRTEVNTLRLELAEHAHPADLRGNTPVMQSVYKTIAKAAQSDCATLILGESGTGKELAARAIHRQSRRSGPFLSLNCSAIPDGLAESELFGHEKGAFTGAVETKKGYFENASGGTLMLDEIGDLPLNLQAKLLRVLEQNTVTRVGSTNEIPVDARIISASNKDLKKEVEQNTFRKDLFFRLNVISITMPPLRDRRDDIPGLIHFFLDISTETRSNIHFSTDAIDALMRYPFPGNVRELENIVNRCIVLNTSDIITASDLPTEVRSEPSLEKTSQAPDFNKSYQEAKQAMQESFDIRYIRSALAQSSGSVTDAAQLMGIGRTVLHRMMKKYNLRADDFKKE